MSKAYSLTYISKLLTWALATQISICVLVTHAGESINKEKIDSIQRQDGLVFRVKLNKAKFRYSEPIYLEFTATSDKTNTFFLGKLFNGLTIKVKEKTINNVSY